MTRNALVGSTVAHVAILVAVFAVRQGEPLIVGGPDVVQVALLPPGDLTAPAPAPAPAPAEKAAMKAPDIQPEKAEGVKLAPPKKPVRKAEPAHAEAAPQASGPALPFARVGNAGLSGAIAVDSGNFEFTYYLMLIRNKVAQYWMPPAGLQAGQPVRAIVYFHVSRGGDVSAVRLETGSGFEFFDRAALRAVSLSDPLPPLPLGFPGSDLGIHFGFEYARP